jgi:hypothetical protein
VTLAPMIAPLANLVFLSTLWLLVVVGARVLEESGAEIAAALRGTGMREPPTTSFVPRGRRPQRLLKPERDAQRLRAAA